MHDPMVFLFGLALSGSGLAFLRCLPQCLKSADLEEITSVPLLGAVLLISGLLYCFASVCARV